jgi:D-alanyl-D-alanine carboxypeptidase/D-alanyl-D-alanine-endopeptidase (penicillin-binding protein 4)
VKSLNPSPKFVDVYQRIEDALAVPQLKNAIIGIHVCSLKNGQTLYERNPDFSLVPASNLKLLTSFAILKTLGADFRYKTTLLYTGKIDENGTLNGDLYLRGSGDPSMTSERLLETAKKLRAVGIVRINGRIIADGTAFDELMLGPAWQWDEESYYYSAQLSGLNCDENILSFHILPGENIGDTARIVLGGEKAQSLGFDGTAYVRVNCTAITTDAKPGHDLQVTRARAANEFLIQGTIPPGIAPVSSCLTVEDPALFTVTRFADLCAMGGEDLPSVTGCPIQKGKTPDDATILCETESETLAELVKPFLKSSNNLYGEAFLKTLGQGTASAGAKATEELLKSCDIDTSGLYVFDGSGLSRTNNLTPRFLTDLLTYVDREGASSVSKALFDGLPIAGVDGTLDDRMKGTPAESHVWAKTGSLSNASSLAGYLKTKTGERLVFSILMNNFSENEMRAARKTQEEIAIALIDVPERRYSDENQEGDRGSFGEN